MTRMHAPPHRQEQPVRAVTGTYGGSLLLTFVISAVFLTQPALAQRTLLSRRSKPDPPPPVFSPRQWKRLTDALDCWEMGSWQRVNRTQFPSAVAADDPFQWQPSPDCPLPYHQWSTERMCSVLDGRSVLLVGDSLSKQLHDAFVAYGERPGQPPCAAASVGIACKGHSLCSSSSGTRPFRFAFTRNDRLLVTTRRPVRSSHLVLLPFNGDMTKYRYRVVVLNKGAHYTSDAMFLREYADTITYLRERYPASLIVVRTTPVGHPQCDSAKGPLADPARSSWKGLPFHWGDIAAQNALLRDMLESRFPRSVVVMDVEHSTALRPDRHRGRTVNRRGEVKLDCLHYAFPGSSVLEEWATRLVNLLDAVGQETAPGRSLRDEGS